MLRTVEAIPEGVKQALAEWFVAYKLLHFWEQEGTYLAVCQTAERLYFVRLWQGGGQWLLSQDKEIRLPLSELADDSEQE